MLIKDLQVRLNSFTHYIIGGYCSMRQKLRSHNFAVFLCLKPFKSGKKNLRNIASDQYTKMADAQEFIKKGEEKKEIEAVIGFYEIGVSPENISKALKVTLEKVLHIIDGHKNR